MKSIPLVFVVALACSACATGPERVVPQPSRISLKSALQDTVDALYAAYDRAHADGRRPIGFYPCTLSASFNISATGTANNELALGTGARTSNSLGAASIGAGSMLTATRGNTIVVTFASDRCLPPKAITVARTAKRLTGPRSPHGMKSVGVGRRSPPVRVL